MLDEVFISLGNLCINAVGTLVVVGSKSDNADFFLF